MLQILCSSNGALVFLLAELDCRAVRTAVTQTFRRERNREQKCDRPQHDKVLHEIPPDMHCDDRPLSLKQEHPEQQAGATRRFARREPDCVSNE